MQIMGGIKTAGSKAVVINYKREGILYEKTFEKGIGGNLMCGNADRNSLSGSGG